jgi:hypothetical protein
MYTKTELDSSNRSLRNLIVAASCINIFGLLLWGWIMYLKEAPVPVIFYPCLLTEECDQGCTKQSPIARRELFLYVGNYVWLAIFLPMIFNMKVHEATTFTALSYYVFVLTGLQILMFIIPLSLLFICSICKLFAPCFPCFTAKRETSVVAV